MQTRGRSWFQEFTHEESGLMQDYELVTRHRFVNEAQKQEQPLTHSEAENEFDALIETQARDQWMMKLPTMRSLHVWVPTNNVWRQQAGTSKSQGTRVVDRNAQRNRSFGFLDGYSLGVPEGQVPIIIGTESRW